MIFLAKNLLNTTTIYFEVTIKYIFNKNNIRKIEIL